MNRRQAIITTAGALCAGAALPAQAGSGEDSIRAMLNEPLPDMSRIPYYIYHHCEWLHIGLPKETEITREVFVKFLNVADDLVARRMDLLKKKDFAEWHLEIGRQRAKIFLRWNRTDVGGELGQNLFANGLPRGTMWEDKWNLASLPVVVPMHVIIRMDDTEPCPDMPEGASPFRAVDGFGSHGITASDRCEIVFPRFFL
jgi:hypothetical protein